MAQAVEHLLCKHKPFQSHQKRKKQNKTKQKTKIGGDDL
jgi:hypothetical protein